MDSLGDKMEDRCDLGKRHFKEGDEVIIWNLGDNKEYKGVICGKQEMVFLDNYIVKFDDPNAFPKYPFSCVQLIESCIKPITGS